MTARFLHRVDKFAVADEGSTEIAADLWRCGYTYDMEDGLELVGYNHDRDIDDVLRVWSETGWFEGEARQEKQIRALFEANDGLSVVGRIDGHVESVVHRTLGSMHYDQTQVSAGAITAVTTSRIARKLGLASRLTARSVAHLADEGCAVAVLGMFEQGFYDRFGFGASAYENRVRVFPGDLDVPVPYRRPERLDAEHHIEEMHAAMIERQPWHGGLLIGGERSTSAGLLIDSDEPSFYGYRTDGAISHYLGVETEGENGPDRVIAMVYQSPEQCFELLRLIQEWGDQVDLIRFAEPAWMQAQDFMRNPGHEYRRTKGTKNAAYIDADAWLQVRIVDMQACFAAMSVTAEDFAIVVDLTDPVGAHLVGSGYKGDWATLTGRWKLSFGSSTAAERVADSVAADLVTSVNALSRWWMGVLSAQVLGAMGRFHAEPEVLSSLDSVTAHLPIPQPGWDV